MQPHPTSSPTTTTTQIGSQDTAAEMLTHPIGIGERGGRSQAIRTRPHLTLAPASVWRHKLILTGRLDQRTVVELEDEIDCLCEEGVTILTLDLRQLDAIDSVGARAIASRGAAYKHRGRDLAVVPGSPLVHHALAEAGTESLHVDAQGETDALSLAAGATDSSPREISTVMVKNL